MKSLPFNAEGGRVHEVPEGVDPSIPREVHLTRIASEAAEGDTVPWEIAACRMHFETGNMSAVARAFNTTTYEINKLSRMVWWQDEQGRLKREAGTKLDAGFSTILDSAVGALLDRVQNGEITGQNKDGTPRRTAMTSLSLARVVNMAFMNRQLLRGEATSIPGDTDAMSRLAQKLRALGAKDPTIIDLPCSPVTKEGRDETGEYRESD